MPDIPMRSAIKFAIGGGWGDTTPSADTIPVRIIRGTDFSRIRDEDYSDIPQRYERINKVLRRQLRPGDIVLEISGGSYSSGQSTGRSLLVSDNILASLGETTIPASFCRLIRFDDELIDSKYAYYCLQEMHISGRASLYENQSTGISNFQFEHFLDSEILRVPSLDRQRSIVRILEALDDRTRLSRRMSRTLEDIARTLFDAWIVAFDPVRRQAKGRKSGLPTDLAGLFSNCLIDSELGPIPRGWIIRGLDQIATFVNGLALQKYPPTAGRSLPVIKIAQLRAGRLQGADLASADLDPKYIVTDGDILFSWSGSLECRFWTGGRGALNQHLLALRDFVG